MRFLSLFNFMNMIVTINMRIDEWLSRVFANWFPEDSVANGNLICSLDAMLHYISDTWVFVDYHEYVFDDLFDAAYWISFFLDAICFNSNDFWRRLRVNFVCYLIWYKICCWCCILVLMRLKLSFFSAMQFLTNSNRTR